MSVTFQADNLKYRGFLSVQTYGAVGNGIANDQPAIKAAIAAAAVLGSDVYFPPGTYLVGQDGANPWCLRLLSLSNIRLFGVPDASVIKQTTGLPASSVACLTIEDCENVVVQGLVIDGNWGNAVTEIAPASDALILPQASISVDDITNFPAAGTFYIVINGANGLAINYTGITPGTGTAGTFTGCTGGAGQTIRRGDVVGYIDSNTGINQVTQADPKNHGIFVRGSTNVLIQDCTFRENYGDGIWIGTDSTDNLKLSTVVRVANCNFNIMGRNGISMAGKCEEIRITGCVINNVYQEAIDVEPIGAREPVRDVVIDGNFLGPWWNPANPARGNVYLNLKGGNEFPSESSWARNVRITNNTIIGATLFSQSRDIIFANNRVDWSFAGAANAIVGVSQFSDDVQVLNNYITVRAQGPSGPANCITVYAYQAGGQDNPPKGVRVQGNRIYPQNGNSGIGLKGPGGVPGDTGTATAVGAKTLTDTTKAWTVNQFVGCVVTMGGLQGAVTSNTATVLTLSGNTEGWFTPDGDLAWTPPIGTYQIVANTNLVEVLDNHIDCTDTGYGQGANGIFIANGNTSSVPNFRARVKGNFIRNANGAGISVSPFAGVDFRHLEISDNFGIDDQVVPTMTPLINFVTVPTFVTPQDFILRGNQNGQGVAALLTGLSAIQWIVEAGQVQRWAGFGAPTNAAPIGSTYQRLDGAAGSCYYVNQTGLAGGWLAIA